MSVQTKSKPRRLNRTKQPAETLPERDETLHLQEQFSGPVALRGERPVAELLAERLAEAEPGSTALLFIP
jgi:hypothetical protein